MLRIGPVPLPKFPPAGKLRRVSARRHRHDFSLLYWHFGPYLDQTVHVHSCSPWQDDPCDRVLIGHGRECDGREESHWRATLTEEGPKVRA